MTVVVRQNAIANVINLSTGSSIPRNEWAWYRTADELFQTVAKINRDTVAQFILEYDPKYGFPRFLYVDFSENWADEEFGYITQFVSRD